MTIEELKDKHFYILHQHKESHTKLSIQFAISVLESDELLDVRASAYGEDIYYKIQELNQDLNEEV